MLNTEKHSVVRAWGVIPEKLNFRRMDESMINGGVETIVCGQDHVLILSKDGRLYTAGNNKYGQCGVDINPTVQYEELRQIEFSGARCKAVAAGSYHTLLLVKKNNSTATRMLAFGNYLGCGFAEKLSSNVPKPVLLPGLDPADQVEDVFAACNNSACVTSTAYTASGRLFMWGELFSIERVLSSQPFEVNFNPPLVAGETVTKVEFGRRHAVMMTCKGYLAANQVFSIGHNTYGELGLGHENRSLTPQLIQVESAAGPGAPKTYKRFIDITAGSRHSLLLSDTGEIYGFGDNSRGQCGFEPSRSNTPLPIQTQGLFGEVTARARFIFCGETHSALITTHGELYMWGSNSGQKLGFQTTNDIYTPTLLDSVLGLSISGVGLGGFMTVIITGPSTEAMIKRTENQISESSVRLFGGLLKGRLGRK